MEARLLVAYLLMACLVLAAGLGARTMSRKRREHRRLMRGQGSHRKSPAVPIREEG